MLRLILFKGFDLKDAVIDVSLIGGYDDERHISKKLSINLIKWILKSGINQAKIDRF